MPFLCQGLERGEKVVYIVGTRTVETVAGYLRDPSTSSEQALDAEPYLTSGQLVIFYHEDAYLREGVFGPDGMIALLQAEMERALHEGYSARIQIRHGILADFEDDGQPKPPDNDVRVLLSLQHPRAIGSCQRATQDQVQARLWDSGYPRSAVEARRYDHKRGAT